MLIPLPNNPLWKGVFAYVRTALSAAMMFGTLLLCSTGVQARETIIWANLHFPPWMILEGSSKGQGVWNLLQQELVTQLPEYDHKFIEMNNARYEQLATEGQKVCKVYYFKTPERERILYFSSPATVFLSNYVVMRRDKAKLLGNPSSISLARLMQDPRFDGSFIEGRSYGSQVDQIIRRLKGQAYLHANVTSNQSLFEFISLGRTDYILEFPAVRAFFEQDLALHPDLVNIAIDEAAPHNITYVTCVRNPWGQQVIGQVNDVLRHYIPTPAYRAATLRWYQPEDQRRLSKFFDRFLVDPLKQPRESFRP
ncbi:MAG: TIGR02285 family protein [Sideroxydans sp.]|jgi:uncharacterized protein (TIGR02285 family)